MIDSAHDIRQRLLIAKLPAMPEILIKLIHLCQTEETGINELAALIGKDAAIASKVLSAASSSLYACRGHKPGLKQSLQTLGMNTTKTLLICESVFQVFNGLANAADLRGFWRHSLMAAMCARKIAAAIDYPHLEEAYLAGLLHDVGRLALLSAAPVEYAALTSHGDDADLCAAEERTLHIGHAEAGFLLIERWGLDSYLADSVLYHHEPVASAVSTHPLIRVVILADSIASHGTSQPTLDTAQALFAMGAEAVAAIREDCEAQLRQAAELLNLDLHETQQAMVLPAPAAPAMPTAGPRQQLSAEVMQLTLNSAAQRLYSSQSGATEVMSAVRQSAALLFGFKQVLLLLCDDAAGCLRGVAAQSGRNDHAEFMMPINDGGTISASLEQRRITYIDADTRLPSLSEEQQLFLQICNGKVKPNVKIEPGELADLDEDAKADSKTPTLAEEQLLRLLDADYLVCLPLVRGKRCLGAVIGAAPPIQIAELQAREAFLMTFANQAATAIDTERNKAEENRRIEAQAAAGYREASRRVIHEANNPLSIIKNYLAVLGSKAERREPVTGELSILGDEINRVGTILRGLAEIKPARDDGPVEIDRIVGELVSFYAASRPAPASAGIRTRLQAGASRLNADGDALKQILLNLIKNAAEATPDGGEILVATSASINRDGRLYCGLTVQDNGPGIAPEVLSRLFSPQETSKGGEHMGLGLSIVHDLVRQLDGTITCRSGVEGTSIEILLPVHNATPTPRTPG